MNISSVRDETSSMNNYFGELIDFLPNLPINTVKIIEVHILTRMNHGTQTLNYHFSFCQLPS